MSPNRTTRKTTSTPATSITAIPTGARLILTARLPLCRPSRLPARRQRPRPDAPLPFPLHAPVMHRSGRVPPLSAGLLLLGALGLLPPVLPGPVLPPPPQGTPPSMTRKQLPRIPY